MSNHTITNGTIKFGRTVKTGDFESKRGDVELSFNVPEGNDADAAIHDTKEKCRAHLHTMLGHPDDAGSVILPKKEVEAKRAAKAAKAPAMPAMAAAAPVETKPTSDPTAMEEPAPAAAKAADPAAIEDEGLGNLLSTDEAPADKKVTDKELLDATQACQQANKNGPAIHKLLAELGVNSRTGGRVIDMAQDKRATYLEKLKLIKPLA